MRNEIRLILAGSLFLYGCSTVEAAAKQNDMSTPEPGNVLVDPTITPMSFEPSLNVEQTPVPYIPAEAIETKVAEMPFLYFSQDIYIKTYTEDGSRLSDVGCGILVGAMVTRTDPDTYYKAFVDYFKSIGKYGPARITALGTEMNDHLAVLESLGFEMEDLSSDATPEEVKAKIKEYTDRGIPVWVNAKFYSEGHHSMATGIALDGSIIFNDSFYGEGVTIPDSEIKILDEIGNTAWKVFAVIPQSR